MGQALDVEAMKIELNRKGVILDFKDQGTPEEMYNYIIHSFNVFIVSDSEVWKSHRDTWLRCNANPNTYRWKSNRY